MTKEEKHLTRSGHPQPGSCEADLRGDDRGDAGLCENCNVAPATERWGGTHDSISLARNQCLIQRWCKRCVLTAQIAYMRELVPKLADAERELAALDQVGSHGNQSVSEASGSATSEAPRSDSHSDPLLAVPSSSQQEIAAVKKEEKNDLGAHVCHGGREGLEPAARSTASHVERE